VSVRFHCRSGVVDGGGRLTFKAVGQVLAPSLSKLLDAVEGQILVSDVLLLVPDLDELVSEALAPPYLAGDV